MPADYLNSIVLIENSDEKVRGFGTGFVIDRNANQSAVATCAHVIRAIEGFVHPQDIRVDRHPATLIASGIDDFPDITVLAVEGLLDKAPLALGASASPSDAFLTAGFQTFAPNFLLRPLRGTLGQQLEIAGRGQVGRVHAWDLSVIDDFRIQPGYSGAPVIHEATGKVVGLVSYQMNEGQSGIAIAIGHARDVWTTMSDDLFDQKQSTDSPYKFPTFSAVRQRVIQRRLSVRLEQYDAVSKQHDNEINAATCVVLSRQADEFAKEIESLEMELRSMMR